MTTRLLDKTYGKANVIDVKYSVLSLNCIEVWPAQAHDDRVSDIKAVFYLQDKLCVSR